VVDRGRHGDLGAIQRRPDRPAAGTLASLPPLGVTALVSFQIVPLGAWTAAGFGLGLLVLDIVMWRGVVALFDRERPVTGSRASTSDGAGVASPGEVRRIRAWEAQNGRSDDTSLPGGELQPAAGDGEL
jgi:hypothetical protein